MTVSADFYLVLLETSGNQNYIFGTNRLKENLGASELTRTVGERWVIQAVQQTAPGTLSMLSDESTIDEQRTALREQPSIFENESVAVEVILAASGKAMLLTKEESIAKEIVQRVTTKALKEAPGLDLCGVVHKFSPAQDFSDNFAQSFSLLLKRVHEQHAQVHATLAGNATRGMRLPIIANCKSSGLPAKELKRQPGTAATEGDQVWRPQSDMSLQKERERSHANKRLNALLRTEILRPHRWQFPYSVDNLDRVMGHQDTENRWLAVIHADGNGLGQIFLRFAHYLEESNHTLAAAFAKLRAFSIALDDCTEAAFCAAIAASYEGYDASKTNNCIPLVPLILGGDDLTVLCDGDRALNFTVAFLTAFEQETQNHPVVKKIASKALGTDHLSACAGVAIVKPHFPFSVAYELAEDLISSAKQVKHTIQHSDSTPDNPLPYPTSALDFHILYDSSNVSLKGIRKRLEIKESETCKTQLTGKPYIVTGPTSERQVQPPDYQWANQHRWEDFAAKVQQAQLFSQETGDQDVPQRLPRSQAYSLRQTLFSGQEPTDAHLKMLIARYREESLEPFVLSLDGKPSLFLRAVDSERTKAGEQEKTVFSTSYLDALEAANFLQVT